MAIVTKTKTSGGMTTTIKKDTSFAAGVQRIKGVFGSVFTGDKVVTQTGKDVSAIVKPAIVIGALGTAAYGGALALTSGTAAGVTAGTTAATTTAATGISLKTAAVIGAVGLGTGLLLSSGGSAKSNQTNTPTQNTNPNQNVQPNANQTTDTTAKVGGDTGNTFYSGRDTNYTTNKNLYQETYNYPSQQQDTTPYQTTSPLLTTEQASTQSTGTSWLIPALIGLGVYVLLKD